MLNVIIFRGWCIYIVDRVGLHNLLHLTITLTQGPNPCFVRCLLKTFGSLLLMMRSEDYNCSCLKCLWSSRDTWFDSGWSQTVWDHSLRSAKNKNYSGPAAWNTLPSDLHYITETSTFRKRLKNVLFDRAYHWLLLALLDVSYSGALQILCWLIDWLVSGKALDASWLLSNCNCTAAKKQVISLCQMQSVSLDIVNAHRSSSQRPASEAEAEDILLIFDILDSQMQDFKFAASSLDRFPKYGPEEINICSVTDHCPAGWNNLQRCLCEDFTPELTD